MTLVQVRCAAGCGQTDRVPAYEDKREKDPEKVAKPIMGHPFICLACWRAGWRCEAPVLEGHPWNVYQLPGHPQVLEPRSEAQPSEGNMENQHRHIKGYRDLTPAEVDLMNNIKGLEGEVLRAHKAVQEALTQQSKDAQGNEAELARLSAAEPGRWASIAKTHFQEGFMALVRAVAQPGTTP